MIALVMIVCQKTGAQAEEIKQLVANYIRDNNDVQSYRLELKWELYSEVSLAQRMEFLRYLETIPSILPSDSLFNELDKKLSAEREMFHLLLGEPKASQDILRVQDGDSFIVRYFFDGDELRNVRYDGEIYSTWNVVSSERNMVQIDINSVQPPFASFTATDVGLRHDWLNGTVDSGYQIKVRDTSGQSDKTSVFDLIPGLDHAEEMPRYTIYMNSSPGSGLSIRRLIRQEGGGRGEDRFALLRSIAGDDTTANLVIRLFPSGAGTFSVMIYWIREFEPNPKLTESDWQSPVLPNQRTTIVDNRVSPPKVLALLPPQLPNGELSTSYLKQDNSLSAEFDHGVDRQIPVSRRKKMLKHGYRIRPALIESG